MKKKIIVYLYNALHDPLIKGNIMLYIMDAAKTGKYDFYFITYEQDQFKLNDKEKAKIIEQLEEINIHWKAFNWSSGSIIRKGFDFLKVARFIFYLRYIKKYKAIISLASVAGAFAYVYTVIFGLKLYLYQYEPHSEYGLDGNMWSKQSLTFKILKFLEKRSAKKATVISSGTRHMMNRLNDWGVKAKYLNIPSVANHQRFQFNLEDREKMRAKFSLNSDNRLVIYSGKFGDLYYENEIGVLFRSLLNNSKDYYFIILTLTDQKLAKKVMEVNNIPKNSYFISSVDYEEMSAYLSAADLGVVAAPPLPSRKFCSNIKVGEYLCNGLPYLICKGVSEDDEIAMENQVGIVIDQFNNASGNLVHSELKKILDEDINSLKKRCRSVGMKYRSFEQLNPRFMEALEAL